MKRRTISTLVMSMILAVGAMIIAGEGTPPPPSQFHALHAMIKRQTGEAQYLEIDWHPNVWEARQKAAREGKPLFIWAGSEGAPSAGC